MRSPFCSAVEGVTPNLIEAERATASAVFHEGVEWLRQRDLSAYGLIHGDPTLEIPAVAKRVGPIRSCATAAARTAEPLVEDRDEVTLLDNAHCSVLASVIPDHGDAAERIK